MTADRDDDPEEANDNAVQDGLWPYPWWQTVLILLALWLMFFGADFGLFGAAKWLDGWLGRPGR